MTIERSCSLTRNFQTFCRRSTFLYRSLKRWKMPTKCLMLRFLSSRALTLEKHQNPCQLGPRQKNKKVNELPLSLGACHKLVGGLRNYRTTTNRRVAAIHNRSTRSCLATVWNKMLWIHKVHWDHYAVSTPIGIATAKLRTPIPNRNSSNASQWARTIP